MKLLTAILLAFICTLQAYAGGGWPQEKGKGYFKLSQSWIIANKFYNPEGNTVDITTISLYTTSLYAEYGITDRFTAVAYMPFFVRSTLNEVKRRQSGMIEPGDEINSFGDTNLGLKYALTFQKKIAVSATLTLGLPLGNPAGGDSKILQTGDGEFNQLLMLDASRSFKGWYVSAGIGFNNRTENFSDEFRLTAEAGITAIKRLTLIGKLAMVESLMNGNNAEVQTNGVFSNNVEYISYGTEIAYDIKEKFGVSLAGFSAFSAKRILASPQYSAGVYYKL
ncbi:hypothetical protein [Fulvivirga ligni]|uniref:hypothetical protein n=1 Tax=Fulvivirga ligni TaxID=2904246 RepID=UPI001F436D40|nr:hypothetical protein [Fulvivirga ligni]UII22222.1 hypothetical protein LVD16_03125 [Fulvivirga ligni]